LITEKSGLLGIAAIAAQRGLPFFLFFQKKRQKLSITSGGHFVFRHKPKRGAVYAIAQTAGKGGAVRKYMAQMSAV
jgi:hypothetical protein